jgi:zinc transport system substrate-binding protein
MQMQIICKCKRFANKGESMKISKICLSALFVALTLTSCTRTAKDSADTGRKIKVSVTFNALKEMAQVVGGEYAEISTIIPDGMEPHEFEPKAQDMEALSTADVFVYNGFGLEKWAPQAIAAAQNKKLIAVDSSAGATPITLEGAEAIEHGGTDPHLWLSLNGAQIQTRNIANAFGKADPAHAAEYTKNADTFVTELNKLYAEYADKMKAAPSHIIVTGHAAFGYLCRDFGLEQNSVEDVFATGEPSPQQLASLVEFAKEKKVKTIFVEEMVSPAVSQTLANEIGAKVATIYTMESAEDSKNYLERMSDNLDAIYKSLSE